MPVELVPVQNLDIDGHYFVGDIEAIGSAVTEIGPHDPFIYTLTSPLRSVEGASARDCFSAPGGGVCSANPTPCGQGFERGTL